MTEEADVGGVHRGEPAVSTNPDVHAALEEQERHFRQALDAAQVGFVAIDAKGTIRSINAAAEDMFGYETGDLAGHNVSALMPEPYRSAHDGYIARYLESGEARTLGCLREADGVRRDGGLFPIRIAVERVEGFNGPRFVAIVRDISARREVEREMMLARRHAEAASIAKSEFLASMSHELRTPLNAILGFSETIRCGIFGPLGNSRYQDYVDDIYESGSHLLRLINDILDVSAIEAGKLLLHEDHLPLEPILDSAQRLIRPRAEAGGVRLRIAAREGLPALWADERRLKQILLNLLSNAVKYTPRGGSVTVDVHQENDGGLVLTVADTGIGMDRDEVALALVPFGRVDNNLTRQYEGTGLGLPLTKALIQLHQGSLAVRSRKGEGTTVTVRFPRERVIDADAIAEVFDYSI